MGCASGHSLGKKSLPQLVRIALRAWGSHKAWRAISALQMRGDAATLALARTLADSASWRRRALGLHIASQLRRRDRDAQWGSVEFALEETHALLLRGLHDSHDAVVAAAVSGLGHRPHCAGLTALVRLSRHADPDLRFDVAVTLGSYSEPDAIDALLALAGDTDDDVRDWATFGLGSMQGADTPAIRHLLWKNLHDTNADVRGESLCGLAHRGDARAVDYLVRTLDENCHVYELDAAETLADPRLLEPLQRIAAELDAPQCDGYWYNRLKSAISACADQPHPSGTEGSEP